MTATVRLGILSFAHVHAPGYATLLQQMPDAELVAIADDDGVRGRAAATTFGAAFEEHYQTLLARDDIDAVVICTENIHHKALTVAAAEAGKHVLCEKPLATTRADGLAMIQVCAERNVKLQTAFPMRFCAPAIGLRQMIQAGAIGTPLAVKATNPGQYPGGWFGDPVLAGGGAVMDHTVHVADLLRWIFATEIVAVYAEIDSQIHGIEADDVAILLLRLANGMPVSLDPSWMRPTNWPTWGTLTMEIIGDQGVLAMDAFSQTLQLFERRGPSHTLVPWAEGGDPGMLRAFVAAIRDDTAPPITGTDGLRATEVALCAYESARRREPVACPDVLEERG